MKIEKSDMSLPNPKLPKCEVCNATEAKYTCPKCEVRTCSVTCVSTHKKELSCDGIRNKVAFKPISKMTNLDLLSDYRLMEEVTRSVESYWRDDSKHFTRAHHSSYPPQLYKLRAAASKRGIRLQFLPQNFSRNKTNTTYLDWKKQIIQWRVEWIFPNAENIKYVDEKIYEEERLGMRLEKYLDPSKCDKSTRENLQWYQATGIIGVKILLKAENIIKSGSRFYELDPSMTLKENLKGKTIIEFPTIFVVLKGHIDSYDILEPEEEQEIQAEIQNEIDSRNNKRKHQLPGNKNLLFNNTDISDSEEEKEKKMCKAPIDAGIPMYDDLIKQEH